MNDYTNLSLKEKERVLKSNPVPVEIINYLSSLFKTLTIEVANTKQSNIMDLMKKRILEGWCFESTNTALLFFQDLDYILRGTLILEKNYKYYHSWICFKYNNIEYVFDPALNYICQKELYDALFTPKINGMTHAISVRKYFLDYVKNPPKELKNKFSNSAKRFMIETFKIDIDNPSTEIRIIGRENPYSEMYRNNTGYNVELEDGQIRKLTAHFYDPSY